MCCSAGVSSSTHRVSRGCVEAVKGKESDSPTGLSREWKPRFSGKTQATGIFHHGERADHPVTTRVRSVLRKHRVIAVVLVAVMALPVAFSPTHPIAVYGFLVHRYASALSGSEEAEITAALSGFLTSSEQLARYREEIRDDMLDTCGGRLFVLLRDSGGGYRQEAIRTWNSFLPDSLPEPVKGLLDYKEIPFLGDEVAVWLRGDTIMGIGHYHPFGGAPSRGDRLARRFSATSEVVISNGLIPFVYLDGRLLPYGETGPVNTEVFRSIRMMEKNLTMALESLPVSATQPTEALQSFLAYLKVARAVDISDRNKVAAEVKGLCNEFRVDYASAFPSGFAPSGYPNDLDRATMLWNLSATEMWAGSFGKFKVASVHTGSRSGSSAPH